MDLARQLRKPYAVVINGVPARRDNTESPFVREARRVLGSCNVPVWSGQITQRTNYSLALAEGEGACEYDGRSEAAAEIEALWSAIERSVRASNGAYQGRRDAAARRRDARSPSPEGPEREGRIVVAGEGDQESPAHSPPAKLLSLAML
jgi:hypothetical protein